MTLRTIIIGGPFVLATITAVAADLGARWHRRYRSTIDPRSLAVIELDRRYETTRGVS